MYPAATVINATRYMRARPEGIAICATPQDAATCVNWARETGVPSRAQESTAGLYCWGGKVSDLAPDANAFVHRNADFLFKSEVLWEPEDDPDLIVANLDWVEGYHAAMQPYLSGGAYQNFTDRSQSDWERAYYGENLERLVDVKRTWDPDNLFQFPKVSRSRSETGSAPDGATGWSHASWLSRRSGGRSWAGCSPSLVSRATAPIGPAPSRPARTAPFHPRRPEWCCRR